MAKSDTQLFSKETASQGPVECLGMTFESDEARRAYFTEKLREKLKDPEFRKIEGFPIGEDEDILALSDPPYYTACPNPFLGEFVGHYGHLYNASSDRYSTDPFAADVSEGRNDVIYTAHTYHTKVPPKAIAKYILHYTSPGDVVLDGFSGAGMTGVACLFCSDKNIAKECGGEAGVRHPILCDISPAATFITSVYLEPPDADTFDVASEQLLSAADDAIGGLWLTEDEKGRQHRVEFQIWAEVFVCPLCQTEVESASVVEAAVEIGTAKEFPCPHCGGLVSKAPSKNSNASRLQRTLKTRFDEALREPLSYLPRAPLFSQVKSGKKRSRLVTTPKERQRLLSLKHESPYWFPTTKLLDGERFLVKDCCASYGITHLHHFYLPRQLRTYSCLWALASEAEDRLLRNALLFFIQSNGLGMTVMNRFGPTHFSQVNKYFSGTLYIPSMIAESSYRYTYDNKRKRLIQAFSILRSMSGNGHAVTTQSSTSLSQLPDNSIDYVFVDPPFGRNLQYSELNQVWEAWLRLRTNRGPEAVMDSARQREHGEYTSLMRDAFREMYRTLKPGRWITVVFHNSSNAVWLAIQEALMGGGFVVADVRTLNKQRETYKQSRQGLVKQDLVISAYKPVDAIESKVRIEAGASESAWTFVSGHLRQLPVFVGRGGECQIIAERQRHLLFDRMIAFFVQRNLSIPLSAAEFFEGLAERFPERDGMYFLADQVPEYDRKRLAAESIEQLRLFVFDEASSIQWLKQELTRKPQTFQEIQPSFMRETGGWQRHEKQLELSELLEQNFLCYEGSGEVPSQIHSYLSSNFHELRNLDKNDSRLIAKAKNRWYVPDPRKEADLERIRHKALMKEFEEYRQTKGKLKVVRTEALRAGFKECWQSGDYQSIVDMAKRVKDEIIQEDPALLMYYDNALMRTGG